MEESEIIQIMKVSITRGCWAGFKSTERFVHFYPGSPATPLNFWQAKAMKSLF